MSERLQPNHYQQAELFPLDDVEKHPHCRKIKPTHRHPAVFEYEIELNLNLFFNEPLGPLLYIADHELGLYEQVETVQKQVDRFTTLSGRMSWYDESLERHLGTKF